MNSVDSWHTLLVNEVSLDNGNHVRKCSGRLMAITRLEAAGWRGAEVNCFQPLTFLL